MDNVAVLELADAIHERTDETSRPHAGFQDWAGWREGSISDQITEFVQGVRHATREMWANKEEMEASIAAARKVLRETVSPELYKQLTTSPGK